MKELQTVHSASIVKSRAIRCKAVQRMCGYLPMAIVFLGLTACGPRSSDEQAEPTAEVAQAIVTSWTSIGPKGWTYDPNPGFVHNGRILDILFPPPGVSGTTPFVGTDGGLFRNGSPLSDTSTGPIVISGVAVYPNNANLIIVGTGEPGIGTPGDGIWRTTNGGTTWNKATGATGGFYPQGVRFDLHATQRAYAGGATGFYTSSNSGSSWTLQKSGFATSFAVDPVNSNIVYVYFAYDGLYKSTNYGNPPPPGTGLVKLTATGLQIWGTATLAIAASQPATLYAQVTDDKYRLGIYKSLDSGANWTRTNLNSQDDQGAFNNTISVSPTDPNIVLAAMAYEVWRTTDGGANWATIRSLNSVNGYVGGDFHAMAWKDGNTVQIGGDHGYSQSPDKGVSWAHASPPISNVLTNEIDVAKTNHNLVVLTTQDSRMMRSANGGTSWKSTTSMDGATISIDPSDSQNMYCSLGFGDQWSRYFSSDGGLGWNQINYNLGVQGWYSDVRVSHQMPGAAWTFQGSTLYGKTLAETWWTNYGSTSNPIGWLTVGGEEGDYDTIWLTTNGAANNRVYYYSTAAGAVLTPRGNGINASLGVLKVVPYQSPGNPNAYQTGWAIMGGTSGGRIYATTSGGATWTDVTGNLPNYQVWDLVADPVSTQKLYVGTFHGAYKTTNGGTTWVRWNKGMPESNFVKSMRGVDERGSGGKFWVFGGAYGRGVWKRDGAGTDS